MRTTTTSGIFSRPCCEAGYESGFAPYSRRTRAPASPATPKRNNTTLHELSRHLIAYTSAPEAAALQRILSAQAVQFPELAKLANEEGWLRMVRGVATIFGQFA